MSVIEKRYGDLRATRDPREMWEAYLHMWRGILFPPAEDVARMNALVAPGLASRIVARAVTPWRIFRVFARDVGAGIFVAIMTKCAVDVVRQTIAPKADRKRDLAAFAADLGLTVADLQRLKDALE